VFEGCAAVKDAVGIEVASKPDTLNDTGAMLDTPLVVIYIVDATVLVASDEVVVAVVAWSVVESVVVVVLTAV